MKNHRESKYEIDTWLASLLPVGSTLIGGGAIWFVWFRYSSLLDRPEIPWYQWIQLTLIALMGILCFRATILFIFDKPSGWSAFRLGLSIISLVLFFNLGVLVLRVIQSVVQGNASFFFDRLLTQPHRILLVSAVMIVFILLGMLGKRDKDNGNHEAE